MYIEANCLGNSVTSKMLVGRLVEVLINIVLINDSRTTRPFDILCRGQQSIFLVSQTICFRMLTLFFNSVNNFEIVQKTCSVLVWGYPKE